MNENYRKAERLIKEGYSNVQDKLIEVMMDIKRSNPGISHPEVMDIFQKEVNKFLNYHKNDRMELPPFSPKKDATVGNPGKVFRDKMPMMKIPYGNKNKKKF